MAAESSKVNPKGANDKNHGQAEDDPDAIRAGIRATREEMTQTMNAIQERLNPEHLRDQAIGSVRRATVGRVEDAADDAKWKVKGAGNDVFETIKSNPAPAVLAAVGLGWLFMESRNRSGRRNMGRGRPGDRYYLNDERYGRGGYDYGYTYDEYGRRTAVSSEQYQGQGVRDRAGQAVGQASDRMQGAAQQATSKVQDVAAQAADTVQGAAANVKDTAGQLADQARDTTQHVAQQAQYQAQMVGSRFGDMMQDNPLVIGAAALALGAIVGFAFPSTEKENQVFGEARDRVVDRAQDVAQDTAQKVQHVATEAANAAKETAKDEAQKQNLTSGSNQ